MRLDETTAKQQRFLYIMYQEQTMKVEHDLSQWNKLTTKVKKIAITLAVIKGASDVI